LLILPQAAKVYTASLLLLFPQNLSILRDPFIRSGLPFSIKTVTLEPIADAFNMRNPRGGECAITFSVTELRPVWVGFTKAYQHISHHIRVSVLVYCDSRCGVRTINNGAPACDTAFVYSFTYLRGDVVKVLPLSREGIFKEHRLFSLSFMLTIKFF